jgi:P63C domain
MLAMTDDKKPGGRANGAIALAKSMTPEQLSERAKKGAAARWGAKPLRATHKGSFKEEFGLDVECFVLDDENKTAVIHQRGMGEALGLGEGGSRLPRFLSGKTIANYLGPELRDKLEKPVIFQSPSLGQKSPSAVTHGYDVTLLIDICKAVVTAEAEGKLLSSQAGIAKQAHIILSASAKAGIKGLVYALAGYDQTRQEVVAAFKFYVKEEAREYEKEFPQQLYEEWYRLYKLPRPAKNKPWKFMHLTNKHVYFPMASSNGRILELTKEMRSSSNERRSRLHQFLSDIGVKALRTHLGQLLGIARISKDQAEYERHVNTLFGRQLEMDLAVPDEEL